MNAHAAVQRLDRIASLDGYRVREANDRTQREAWHGQLGVFKDDTFQFASDSPYTIRGWLSDMAAKTQRSNT